MPRSYDLKDLWSYASPRVGRDSFAAKVQSVMQATPNRHIYRPTHFHDIVPTVPPVYYVPGNDGYKHVGEGWKLSPNEANYVVARKNEVGTNTTIENDPKPNSMEFHCELICEDLFRPLLTCAHRAMDVLYWNLEGLETLRFDNVAEISCCICVFTRCVFVRVNV